MDFSALNSFRQQSSSVHVEKKNEPPKVMVRSTDQDFPTLTNEQVQVAKEELVNDSFVKLSFPKKQKLRVDPPLNGQHFCLHSFIPSVGASPDKDGCFGIVKFRGAFPTEKEADEWAEHLIRNVDCLNGIYVGYVGREFPIMAKPSYVNDVKEHDLKQKMDKVVREDIKSKQEEEKKIKQEIEERTANLTKPPEPDYERTIEYYTTLRVKRAQILYTFEQMEKKRKELTEAFDKTIQELEVMDKEYPEYVNQYKEMYEKGLSDVGLTKESNPVYAYFDK
jgi:hypothetical protein